MNTSMIKGLVIGGVLATAGGAIAGFNMAQNSDPATTDTVQTENGLQFDGTSVPEFAEVVDVTPATTQVEQAKEVCRDVEVTHQKAPRDEKRVAGTATGAIVGGLLGNQVGGGNGKKVATVVGAIAGGIAGNKIQEKRQQNDTYTTVETQCETVSSYVDRVIGYDVTYRIGEEQGQIRMDEKPGDTIPLIDGALPQADA